MPEPTPQTMYIKSPGGKRLERLSPEVLASVSTGRLVSPQVEAAAVTIIDQIQELDRGLPLPNFLKPKRPLSRSILVILQYYSIQKENLRDLIKLLSRLGYAQTFFSLAEPDNDDGLKNYLLNDGILWGTIFDYHEFSAWDGVKFIDGFLIGLGASFISILEVFKELFDFSVDAFNDPREARKKIDTLIDGIKQLTVESLIQFGPAEWHKLNYEFSQALLDLEFFRAGYILGKLGGDLWQLLTGIAALRKLPGMTMRLATKFTPLFIAGARRSAQALKMLAELLVKIGTRILIEAPSIGLSALGNLVEDLPALLKKLKDGLLLIKNELGQMIIIVPEEGLELAEVGNVGPGIYFAREIEGTTTIVAKVRTSVDKAEDFFEGISKSVKRVPLSTSSLKYIEEAKKVVYDVVKQWKDVLQKIILENKLDLNAALAGIWKHSHLATEDLAIELGRKSFSSIAEKNIRKVAKNILKSSDLTKALKRAEMSLFEFIKKESKVQKVLELKGDGELLKFLKELGYTDPTKTLIGNLKCDATFFNKDVAVIISVDFTSGADRYGFAKKAFESGKNLSEAELLQLAKQLSWHSLREYAIRDAILEFVFEGWETKALEALYDPFKLVK